MSEFKHSYVEANGIRMHVAEAGSGPAVLLCHGFPEIWYSWRHQMRALADAGFRAIAPDQRGYGETDAPAPIEAYTLHHLIGDLTGVLDALGIERAAIVGHDWGGLLVWPMALLAAHRVAAVVGVNTPYFPRGSMKPTDLFRALAQGNFHYILYFQQPGLAEAELEADVARSLRGFFQEIPREIIEAAKQLGAGVLGPAGGGILDRLHDGPHGAFLTPSDFEVFVRAFERSGFRGGLNWYRNFDRNWELTAYLSGAKVMQPALMITAELDPVLRPEMAAGLSVSVPNLREIISIQNCGHWTQQEKPEEVNRALIKFLRAELKA